jgi:hypothetical protein
LGVFHPAVRTFENRSALSDREMDALKSLMASPKRLMEAVGEYVADRVVGPVPMQSLAADSPRFLTHPPAAPPAAAIAAPIVAAKRQSIAGPLQSIAVPLASGGVKKASPGSKKKTVKTVSPLKIVKPEPMSKPSPI